MTTEPAWNAHYRCVWCHGLKARQDTIHYNGNPVCRDGDCLNHMKGKHRASHLTLPLPRSVGYYDKG